MKLYKSLISLTPEQSLIVLWTTIETLFSDPSKNLLSKREIKKIISFIKKEIDTKETNKAKMIKDILPQIKIKKRNDIIVDNIMKICNYYKREKIAKIIRNASQIRGKQAHKLQLQGIIDFHKNIKDLRNIIKNS